MEGKVGELIRVGLNKYCGGHVLYADCQPQVRGYLPSILGGAVSFHKTSSPLRGVLTSRSSVDIADSILWLPFAKVSNFQLAGCTL
jgi:hypothetical protein